LVVLTVLGEFIVLFVNVKLNAFFLMLGLLEILIVVVFKGIDGVFYGF